MGNFMQKIVYLSYVLLVLIELCHNDHIQNELVLHIDFPNSLNILMLTTLMKLDANAYVVF